jgi:hypothetical protein
MITPMQYPRCSANIQYRTEYRDERGNLCERGMHELQGTCSEVFDRIQKNAPPEMEILEGKVIIEFDPENEEIYTIVSGSIGTIINRVTASARLLYDYDIQSVKNLKIFNSTPKSSFEQVFEEIKIYMSDIKQLRILIPLSVRGLTISNLAIRHQADVKR